MTHRFYLSLSIALAMPSLAPAESLSFGGGISVTSNYISDGLSETGNRPAIQPFVELGKGGFYAGLWATNLRYEDGNRREIDLYGGYRGQTTGGVTYDLGYSQHFFDKTHAASSEFSASLGVPVSDRMRLTGEVSYDPSEKTFGTALAGEYTLADGWSASANIGKADPSADPNFGIGLGHDLSEQTSIDLQYAGTTHSKGLVALTLNYRFGKTTE